VRTIQDLELVISSKRLPGVSCAVSLDIAYDNPGGATVNGMALMLHWPPNQFANVSALLRDPDIYELIEREIAAYEKAECLEDE
jgi:hypothetical protein